MKYEIWDEMEKKERHSDLFVKWYFRNLVWKFWKIWKKKRKEKKRNKIRI